MEQENLQRDFKGIWIPKDIWLEKELTALDKIILLEIDSLDTTEEGCYASNEYLAEFCQCTETKISISIKKLIKMGYLEVIKFDGRKRYLRSNVSLKADFKKVNKQTLKKLKADFKKVKDINIDNNIINNKEDIINKDKIIIPYKEIIDYLNLKTNSNYKHTTQKTKDLIKARYNDGFTLDDFKKVIDNKVEDWNKTDMQKYLRPETLFGNKFEGYLNQKSKNPDWFNKEFKNEPLTEEEKQEFDDLLDNLINDINSINEN